MRECGCARAPVRRLEERLIAVVLERRQLGQHHSHRRAQVALRGSQEARRVHTVDAAPSAD